jgi:Do/DeqQ family serine protease
MRPIYKNLLFLFSFILFVATAPFLLGHVGFWGSAIATAAEKKAPSNSAELALSFSQGVELAAPAVVSLMPVKEIPMESHPLFKDPFFRQFFGDMRNLPPQKIPSIGSGVIVDKKGYILTNNHVVSGADEIKVRLTDGREADAKVVGIDADSDLAILQIKLKDLPVISIGNSSKLKVGDIVLAIGNPFGVGQTVTQGIISATNRSDLGINAIENFLQTDAAINPGNSGGALIDSQGNLVGINNAIFTRSGGYQGIGFAIPIDLAKDVMAELIEHGHVTRGWLGVTVRKMSDEIRKSLRYPKGDGVVIAGVVRGGPAFNAGIRPGDILIAVNNEKTTEPNEVLSLTAKLKPDEAYPISVIREGQIHDYRVIIGMRPVQPEASANPQEESSEQRHPHRR